METIRAYFINYTKTVSGVLDIITSVLFSRKVTRDHRARYLPLRYLLLYLCLLTGSYLNAQVLWQQRSTPDVVATGGKYLEYNLDFALWTAQLKSVPAESNTAARGTLIRVPDTDGQLIDFFCKETQLLRVSPGTPVPDIHTYTGYTKDQSTSLYLTTAPGKIYGSITGEGKSWYISTPEEHITGNTVQSIAVFDEGGNPFNKEGIDISPDLQPETATHADMVPDNGVQLKPTLTPSVNCSLKTFRLALACTAEYTEASGGQAGALVNLTALVNAINAIYERDAGIRFTLVTNNNLIYTDSTTDPFDNNTPGGSQCSQLDSAKASFVANLALADYDIGTAIFYRNFGGCAGGSACGANKGKAVSGFNSTNPTSYLRSVAIHELAHLLGVGHSHNANGPGCSFSPSTAWEPGGGSSVMAYTGCSPAFTSLNTTLYFHSGSINQMKVFTAAGGNCYSATPAGTTPLITTPSNDTFFIPVSTPYRLFADATDAEDNSLLYAFDQMDKGTGTTVAPSDTTSFGPTVRSFEPSSVSYRYVPRMDSLVANYYPMFESLPAIERTLTFWARVSDNHPGCSCYSVDTFLIRTKGTQAFVVTSQSSPVNFAAGSSQTITWNDAGTTLPPFNVSHVKILFAADGLNYNTVLAAHVPNSGSANVTIPNIAATKGRVMVAAVDNIFFNINSADIAITPPCSEAQYSMIWPEQNITALQGDAALNPGFFPSFGLPIDTLPGEIATTDPTGVIAYKTDASDTTSCHVGNGFSGRYDVYTFQVVKSGVYTTSYTHHTLSGTVILSLYSIAGYTATAAAACDNYLHWSSGYVSGGNLGYNSFFSYPATENTRYCLPALKIFMSATGTYRLNFSGPAKIFTEVQNPASAYGYLVVDSAGTIVYTSSTAPNLQSYAPGSYTVYGVSYSPSINLANYLNQPFSSIYNENFSTSRCAVVSTNSVRVTIQPNIPLHTAYLTLNAVADHASVLLNWNSAPEPDSTVRFYVERSGDAGIFSPISSFSAMKNKTGKGQFRYRDDAPAVGRNFYRIRQEHSDRSLLYSNVAVVSMAETKKQEIILVPNPVTSKVTLQVRGFALPLGLSLCDMTGRLIARYTLTHNNYQIDLSALTPGMYLLKGEGFAGKIIKQ